MSVVTKAASNFALPSTQNTAPVHEYQCLYTHDVRKKAKKWHDGSTRFHTFNRRVMVYDDSKSFIGDLHYRADEEFGEGIELHLDRGVLVVVGQRSGESQTDLTGIVNKPHASNSSPHAIVYGISRPVQRAVHLNSHGRPKTLHELLGTSQNRPKGTPQLVSALNNQRQTSIAAEQIEPPLKRQKTISGKENIGQVEPHMQQPDAYPISQSSPTRPKNSVLSRQQHRRVLSDHTTPVRGGRNIVDISSDEEPPARNSAHAASLQQKKLQKAPQQDRNDRVRKPPSTKEPGNTQNEPAAALARYTESPRTTSPIARKSIATSPELPNSNEVGSDGGMSFLKMQSQKPRPKLMYRALLPSGRTENTVGALRARPSANNPDILARRPVVSYDHTLHKKDQDSCSPEVIDPISAEMDSIFDLGGIGSGSEDGQDLNPECSTMKQPLHQDPVLVSPLFVSQSESHWSPSPTKSIVRDDPEFPGTQDVLLQIAEQDIHIPCSPPETPDHEGNVPEADSPWFPLPPPQAPLQLQNAVVRVSAEPEEPSPAEPIQLEVDNLADRCILTTVRQVDMTKARAFTRSLSEHDAPLPVDPQITFLRHEVPLIEKSPLKAYRAAVPVLPAPPIEQVPMPPPPSPFSNPQRQTAQHNVSHTTSISLNISPDKVALQRSKSDTAAIVPTKSTTATVTSITTGTGNTDQGPWTSLEAFLLFDRWPDCKAAQKPLFERPSTSGNGNEGDYGTDDNGSSDEDGFVFRTAARKLERRHDDRVLLQQQQKKHPVLIRSARAVLRDGIG